MPVQAFLGGLVVIRHHRKAGVRAGFLRRFGQFDRFGRGIPPRARDDRNAALGVVDGNLDEFLVLVEVHRRRFTGCPDDDDAVGPFVHMEVDQAAKPAQVEPAVVLHGRHDCNQASGDHGLPS